MHRRTREVVALTTLGAAASALGACEAPEYPGELVAGFEVTETLLANECGADGFDASSQLVFLAELRVHSARPLWRRPRAPVTYGARDTDGGYRFSTSRDVTVNLPDFPDTTCVLSVDETLVARVMGGRQLDDGGSPTVDAATVAADGAVAPDASPVEAGVKDAGAGAATLTGDHTIRVRARNGGACSPLVGASPGQLDVLPCSVMYSLAGVEADVP